MFMGERQLQRIGSIVFSSLLAISLFGCSSPPSSSGGTDRFAEEKTPTAEKPGDSGAAPTVIKIGAPFPLTGPWAEGGQNSLNGVELAIQDINDQGGIQALGGAKLELVSADTSSNDPNQSAQVTRRLIENNASALIGSYVSSLSLTATTEAEKGKVPIITQSYVDQLTERGYKYTFQIPPKSSAFGENTVKYISDIIKKNNLDIKTVAFVANNDANSIAAIESAKKTAEELGFDIVLTETYPPGITDATPVITKIKSAQPGFIFMAGVLQDQILVIRSLRSQNIETPIVGMGGGGFLGKGFAEALGAHSDQVFSLAAWNWDIKNEGVEEVNKRYMAKYNEPFMPQEAGESYIGAWLIKEAIEKAGSADPQLIRDQLASLSFESAAGGMMVGGKIKFDDTGLNTSTYPVLIEWKDSLPHSVWPEADQVMEPIIK